jgi:hypothetical protein
MGPQTSCGKIADEVAKSFRRDHVEQLLERFIFRREVGVVIYDEQGRGSVPSDKLRLNISTKIDMKDSSYGFDDLWWDCTIDALHLTKLMEERRWRGEREKKYDWLVLERKVRLFFETNGCPPRKDDVYDAILKELENYPEFEEPSAASLRALIAEVRREYEDSD